MDSDARAAALERAVGLHRNGCWDEAATLYQEILDAGPPSFEAFFYFSQLRGTQHRYEHAIQLARAAVTVLPGSGQGQAHLASLLTQAGRPAEALPHYANAIAIAPNDPAMLNNLGSALYTVDRIDAARRAFELAILRSPDYADAHYNLGRTFAIRREHERAKAHFERAIALDPQHVEAYNDLGALLSALGHYDEALAAHRKALDIRPDHAPAHASIGNLLLETGKIDQAAAAYARAIELDPGRPDFYRHLVNIGTLAAGDSVLETLERLIGNASSLSNAQRTDLHFALARAYDGTGAGARAAEHLLAANALKRATVPYDEAATLGLFQRVEQAFTATFAAAHDRAGHPSPVPVFVVGMPRSGTTLIEQIIASHPAAYGAGELTDFERVVSTVSFPPDSAELFDAGRRYVEAVTALAPGAARITDKMPENFVFAGLIHLALPNARIVHARRDPADTCLSIFSASFTSGHAYAHDLRTLGRYYRAYLNLMEHWRTVLPPGVMLEMQYEELVADLEGQSRRMLAHCGLEWNDACLNFHQTQRPVRTASASQVRRPIYTTSIGKWKAYANMLEPLLEELGSV